MTTTGPNGEKRPKDPIARAVHVARIATGEIEEVLPEKDTELARIAAETLTLEEKPKLTPPPPPPPGPDRTVERAMDPDTVTTT